MRKEDFARLKQKNIHLVEEAEKLASRDNIIDRLVEIRNKSRNIHNEYFTKDNISDLLGLRSQAYGLVEKGKQQLKLREAAIFCRFMGTSIEELVFGTVSQMPSSGSEEVNRLKQEIHMKDEVISSQKLAIKLLEDKIR